MPEPSTAQGAIPILEADDLRRLLESAAPIQILDIRPSAEREEWSIAGSLHRDVYAALRAGDVSALDGVPLDPSVPVVAVCARGNTSLIAARALRERGFDASSLGGGMTAWSLAWNTAELRNGSATVVQVRRTGKGCLSYVVGSGREAIVVDASVDAGVYLEIAAERGWSILHVLDTHIHADHVSRSRSLAERAGASYWLPVQRRARFEHSRLEDRAQILFGDARLRAIHTPGHTMESACYLVDDAWLFTGDTIFPGAVGRPDLAASSEQARERARLLHRSLRRLAELDPDVLILAAHTDFPTPFDGRPVSATLRDAMGPIRLPQSEDLFVERVLSRLPATPANHHRIVELNEAGELPAHDLGELEAGANRCAVS
jgi:glyoxylase-like metal-dependent hydrolase (beta-lactamase superfamily II)